MKRLTLQEIEVELDEKREDLSVFTKALDLMRGRVQRSSERSTPVLPLHEWAGATGLVDIVTVITNNMARVVEELELERLRALHNRPKLTLVEGGEDEQGSGKAS